MKKTLQDKRQHLMLRELNAITDDMVLAMERAYLPYIADHFPPITIHMQEVLAKYHAWAKKYVEAGYAN